MPREKNFDYQKQAEHLTKFPQKILSEWTDSKGMFAMLYDKVPNGKSISLAGCPTMIKRRSDQTAYLNNVRQDHFAEWVRQKDIPDSGEEIKPEHFPQFIEIQQEFDKMIEGTSSFNSVSTP